MISAASFRFAAAVSAFAVLSTMPESLHAGTDFSASTDAALGWLADMQNATGVDNGLVDSFEDTWDGTAPVQKAYTYDQAVAAIAFTVAGDTARARKVLSRLSTLQAADGSWCNSYWYNNYYGEEIRLHVGPAMWVALAVMNWEKITGDAATFHGMATKTIDWCLTFQRANGALSGGRTTWDTPPDFSDEQWSSTEHNLDAYPALLYFAETTPEKSAAYTTAATKIKEFLDNVVWDDTHKRFYGGYKNNTATLDPAIPMDVNPWGVLALGLSGTHEYAASLSYIENANGNPGTLANPCYKHTLPYAGSTITAYDFDWQSDNTPSTDPKGGGGVLGPDIWFEGSFFMSCAWRYAGDSAKADEIITQLVKKMGKDGSKAGGLPYSLNATNNNYWAMANTNCVSSTGWMVIAAKKWNPFQGTSLVPDNTALASSHAAGVSPGIGGISVCGSSLSLSVNTSGRYELDVCSLDGRTIASVNAGELSAGVHSFPVGGLAKGVYLLRMNGENIARSVRFVKE